MSLRQMEYFAAVVEEGSFTRAAERLFVTQPALSHQIKALEKSVGGALLERRPHAVYLTPMGRAFLPHATAAVRAADEAYRAASSVGQLEAGGLRPRGPPSLAPGGGPAAGPPRRPPPPPGRLPLPPDGDIHPPPPGEGP